MLNILVETQQDWRNIAITHLTKQRLSWSPESRTRQQLPSQMFLEDALCPWSTFVLAALHATLHLLSLTIHTPAASWSFGSKDAYFIARLHIQKRWWNHHWRISWYIVYCWVWLHWHQPRRNGKPACIVFKRRLFRVVIWSPWKLLWGKLNFATSKLPRKEKNCLLFCRQCWFSLDIQHLSSVFWSPSPQKSHVLISLWAFFTFSLLLCLSCPPFSHYRKALHVPALKDLPPTVITFQR